MNSSALFKQYVWLADTIRIARRITLAELSERWQHSELGEGSRLNRATFNRHRAAVEEIVGLTIACDADNRYYIIDNNLLGSNTVQEWMLSTIAVSNIVGEARSLHDRILLESIPTDGELLQHIVEAMQRGLRITISYRRYGRSKDSQWTLEPYCIKLFRRRWYVLCRTADNSFIVFSLDRITSLSITDETFTVDPSFCADAYFSEYTGVMTDDRVPLQRIVLRAYGNERFALKDLPLHHSQRLLKEADDHVDFELRLRPTSDFIAHLLSRGKWVKVITPKKLSQEIANLHREAIETSE